MTTSPAHLTDIADRLFAAIERGDLDELAALWSEDIVVWRQGGGRERDKPRALKVIEWFVGATADRRYEVLDRQVFDGGFVQQHIVHATHVHATHVHATHVHATHVHATDLAGEPLSFRAALVVKVDAAGLISRIDEYLDPADLAPLAQS